jgi:HK97 family phage portal protein
MNIFGLQITKRNKQESVQEYPTESSATSLIFGGYRLEDKCTSLSSFYAALELISNSIAQLPLVVKRDNEVDKNHPLNLLFKDMLISKYMFMKMMINDVILYGNAFAYIERAADGTPINLVYCEHGSVSIIYNQKNQEIFYQIPFIGGKKQKVEAINVIHLYKDSNNGVEGRSLITYANQIIKLSQATDKAASKYYSSGCALQGALTIKGARKGAKEQARQAFAETHGDKGSGLVILDDDMTYTPISSNANESQMLEARTFNVQEIARFFNINPILLGDKDGASYNSIELANIEFVTHTLMPYIVMIEEEFNRKLVKPSETNIRIDLDEKFLMMRGDMKTTSEYLTTLTSGGIITINEARGQLGLSPVEGGDEIIMPYTKIEDNKINKTDEDGDQGIQEQ